MIALKRKYMLLKTKNEIAALYHYFTYTQEQLFDKLKIELSKYYSDEDNIVSDGFIFAKGNIPIALVAHLDTVFSFPPQTFFYDEQQSVLWSPDGLGADDRAGVIMILKLLEEGLRPYVIFTKDEEIGGLGADDFMELIPKEFVQEHIQFFIELDRAGKNDCVFYESGNKHFHKYIESFGFCTEEGIFSDISLLCPHYEIEGVNLSVGSYNSHAYNEYLNFKEWTATYYKVKNILQEPSHPLFAYYERQYVSCPICGKKLDKEHIENFMPWNSYLCSRCYAKYGKGRP